MKIVIVGPGAIGCLFAGFLSRTENEVWLLDKNKKRAEIIAEKGIIAEGISGIWKTNVHATDNAKDIGKANLVMICTKSYDTEKAIKFAAQIVREGAPVLTLQNGIGNIDIIASHAGEENVICGVTGMGSTLLGDGHIRHAGMGETFIGRPDNKITPFISDIRKLFRESGLETGIPEDIQGVIWSKLVVNAGINALTAITRLNNGQLIEFEGTRLIMREAVAEAVEVAKRKKIKLVYDDPQAKVESVCRATAANVSSMLQDVLKEKRTEIDFINGAIVSEGRSLRINTPVNKTLMLQVKTIEQSYALRVKKNPGQEHS